MQSKWTCGAQGLPHLPGSLWASAGQSTPGGATPTAAMELGRRGRSPVIDYLVSHAPNNTPTLHVIICTDGSFI